MFEGRLFLKLGFLSSWKRHSGNALPPINTVQIRRSLALKRIMRVGGGMLEKKKKSLSQAQTPTT